jgi:hypothetical protein
MSAIFESNNKQLHLINENKDLKDKFEMTVVPIGFK